MIASAQTSNSKLAQINNKLTVQSQNFADDSCAIRSLDWDRSRFDIEFGLMYSTFSKSFEYFGSPCIAIACDILVFACAFN